MLRVIPDFAALNPGYLVLQAYTIYEAGVLAKGSRDDDDAAVVKDLAGAAAAVHWWEGRLEPASSDMQRRAGR